MRFATLFSSVFQPPADIPVLSSGSDGKVLDIVKMTNTDDGELGNFALPTHIDRQWTSVPSPGLLLYALEAPPSDGETRSTNLARAHGSFDEATRREIDGLCLISYNPFIRLCEGGYGDGSATYRTSDIEPIQGSEHPLVRTHLKSGRRVLSLSAHAEVETPGYDPARGQALIGRLRGHLARPELSYSHAWSAGGIVWRDNQAVLHVRNALLASERWYLKRVSSTGSRPF